MASFDGRLKYDETFKVIAQGFFQTFLAEQVFLREVGVEASLRDIHEHIRFKRDITSEFVRYAPDGFVFWNKGRENESWLVEFKAATTGFRLDNARPLVDMRQKVSDLLKEEIANIELGSFANLLRLRSIGVNVIIWLYIPFHPASKFLAIIPEARLNLRTFTQGEMRQTEGSGTPIANVFVRIDNKSVFDLSKWIAQTFPVSETTARAYFAEKEKGFQSH